MAMTFNFQDIVPREPGWKLDWQAIDASFDWVKSLAGVPQDPVFHTEGDVWIHTRLVCEALSEQQEWQALPENERTVVFWAAVLHDVAKPVCTKEESDGQITARGHSRRGQIMARKILWELSIPVQDRETICHMVTHHQVPFFFLEREQPERLVYRISHQTRCDLLATLAEADIRGRECTDKVRLLDNIELFREFCRDLECFERPKIFPSDHSRFIYFRKPDRSPDYNAFDDTRSRVTLMSGLPAAGKNTWVRDNLDGQTVISLDEIRRELGIEPTGNQGKVVSCARERARELLRKSEPFVWNGTNLSRQFRLQRIDLFADYNAWVKIVYVETSPDQTSLRNANRDQTVPQKAMEKMLNRWECPDLTECHELECVTT